MYAPSFASNQRSMNGMQPRSFDAGPPTARHPGGPLLGLGRLPPKVNLTRAASPTVRRMSKARKPVDSLRKLRITVRIEVLPLLFAPTRIVVASSNSRRVSARRRKLETSMQASRIGGWLSDLTVSACESAGWGVGLPVLGLSVVEEAEIPCVIIARPSDVCPVFCRWCCIRSGPEGRYMGVLRIACIHGIRPTISTSDVALLFRHIGPLAVSLSILLTS